MRGNNLLLFFTLTLTGGVLVGCQAPIASHPPAGPAVETNRLEFARGGIVRGDVTLKRIALAFTAHQFAEGSATILDELQKHHGHGSFFLTGTFVKKSSFHPLIRRMADEGHYLSLHSDRHLLYCSWEKDRTTLVSQKEFAADLARNHERYRALDLEQSVGRYFLPPYEHYNEQIVAWAADAGYILINYTPGTRSHADYTGEKDSNFTSSQRIFASILQREQTDPHGLNGFILLLHLGSGPGRTDKFHVHFGALVDELTKRGYAFVRVDELLEGKQSP